MAVIDEYIEKLIKLEVGVGKTSYETLEEYFCRSKKYNSIVTNGTYTTKNDKGGMTIVGVTLNVWKNYMKRFGTFTDAEARARFRNISFSQWKDILLKYYWNACKGSSISHQQTAELFVDWGWNSGVTTATKRAQRAFGLTDDGIIGPKTLAALNGPNSFDVLKKARLKHYEDIVKKDPSQGMFLKGWKNRLMIFDL